MLKDCVANNKIEPGSCGPPNVGDDYVYVPPLSFAADELVGRTGPDLRDRCKFECPVTNDEEE